MVKWLLAALVLTLAGFFFFSQRLIGPWPRPPRLQVGSATVAVEIRDDDQERSLGLSGRETLGEDEGMLFIFDQSAIHEFWMKDMNFPLDFVWINNDVVVDLSEHIPESDKLTNEPPMTVRPKTPANWVLEVNGGWIERHGVKIGDRVLRQ